MPQKPLDSEYECGRLVARQQPSWLPVLPDYRAHRGLLSSGLWKKCERTEQMSRRVPLIVKYGSSPAACGRKSVLVQFWHRHTHLAKYYKMSISSPIVSHDINCGNSIFGFPFSFRKDIILIAEIELNP